MGNGEAKELICMTHGHELRWGSQGWGETGREEAQERGGQRGEKEMGQL